MMRKQARLAVSFATCMMALGAGCGDDGEGADTQSEEDAAAPRDAATVDSAARDASSASDAGRDGGTPRDASTGDDAGRDAGGDAGSDAGVNEGVFEGDPQCPDFDPHLKGSIASAQYEYTPAGVTTVLFEKSFYTIDDVDGNGERVTYLQLEWNQSLRTGKPVPLTGGYLAPPPQTSGKAFCILDGRIGLAAEQRSSSGAMVQFEITKVKQRVGTQCQGAEQPAALRGCTYRIGGEEVE